MTFAEIYAAFGCYLWLAGVAGVTYFLMKVLKKTFIPVTKWLSGSAKTRRNANTILGLVMSVGVASLIGALCNMLLGLDTHFMWFVGAGALANYAYLIKERFVDAEKMAMAEAVADAVHESNKNISETDFPAITAKVKELTEAFKTSESNVHAKEVSEVATGIAGAVGISKEEIDKVKRAIADIKEAGIDVSHIEKLYEEYMADGKITPSERDIIVKACEIIRKTYGIN